MIKKSISSLLIVICIKSIITTTNNNKGNKLILISFDGFRFDYLYNTSITSNMLNIIKNNDGIFGNMLSTFVTKTLPNHQSIATGLYQEYHGIVHNKMYDPLFDEYFNDKSPEGEKWWDNPWVTPIYIANQLSDPQHFSCCSPWPGCHVSYHGGKYQTRHFRRFNNTACPYDQLEWVLSKMSSDIEPKPANLAMIYIYEPDSTGHKYGPFGQETLQKVFELDQYVGHIKKRLTELNMINNTNVILLSDHGIAQINPYQKSIILERFLNKSCYEAYGSNPIYTISIHPGFENNILTILTNKSKSLPFKIYQKHLIPKRYHYKNNLRISNLLLMAEEGWSLFNTEEEFLKEIENQGQHGYDNLSPSMKPLFLAFGPNFRKNYHYHSKKFTNIDLYPLMLKLLDIDTNQYYHQGNLSNVIEMLKQD